MQEAKKAINKSIQHKSQYEDEQKYSITSVNINCPRTMSIRKYFPVTRDIQGHPHKIKPMARDKK